MVDYCAFGAVVWGIGSSLERQRNSFMAGRRRQRQCAQGKEDETVQALILRTPGNETREAGYSGSENCQVQRARTAIRQASRYDAVAGCDKKLSTYQRGR
jgi:hypothetical protein